MSLSNSNKARRLSQSDGKSSFTKYRLFCALAPCVILVSCGNMTRKHEIEALQAERDSLLAVTHEQDSTRAIFDSYLETIAETLDSIKTQERILTLRVDEKGRALRKSEIRANLELLANVIKRQRERIEEMEAMLLQQGVDSTSHYRSLISHLYDELDAKKSQVEQLQKELSRKAAEVSRLNKRVDMLETDVTNITEQAKEQADLIEQQTEILKAQNQMLNVGYIKVGSKKELQNAGILKSSLFSAGRLNPDGIDKNMLDEIDIREVTEITVSSKKPKLLTAHPASSYRLDGNGSTTVLVITDPASFWSASNYLIIQL